MQATRQAQTIPTRFVAIFAALAALAAGSALGYGLKPAEVIQGPTRVVVADGPSGTSQDSCLRLEGRKAC